MSRPLPPALALAVELHGAGHAVFSATESVGNSTARVQALASTPADIEALEAYLGFTMAFGVSRVAGPGGWDYGSYEGDARGGIEVHGTCRVEYALSRGATLPAAPPASPSSGCVVAAGAASEGGGQ